MPDAMTGRVLPGIIQGGMGIAVSTWRLARAVAMRGQLGVVSGTAIERVIACRLQEGDPDGLLRSTLRLCPLPGLGERVIARWWQPAGLASPGAYRAVPMHGLDPSRELLELTVAAAFAEVALAKGGHHGPVGINLLTRVQPPTLPVLYGALLAGVDVVLMGAGIPREIPGHLDRLARLQPTAVRIPVAGGPAVELTFEPSALGVPSRPLRRPRFIALVSSDVLAQSLLRAGGVDGFVVEGPTAGGHNAPPRGGVRGPDGAPSYGPRDRADLVRMHGFGLPFWLAGGQATAGALAAARAAGAAGVQVGTAFAFCDESGISPALRRRVLGDVIGGVAHVRTDPRASPTGFPFKLVERRGEVGARRERRPCSLGYLRHAYRRDDGSVGWRCPAEPERAWIAKGGAAGETAGRRCLCNGLFATAGHPHAAAEGLEPPIVTAGEDLMDLVRYLRPGRCGYSAADVIDAMLAPACMR